MIYWATLRLEGASYIMAPITCHRPNFREELAMGSKGKRGEVRAFDSVDKLARSLAEYVAEISHAAIKERGVFTIALSGGSLISTLRKLCDPPYSKTIDWSKWHVFWVDERVVPLGHPESNYKLAKDGLLSKVPIILGQVHPINGALSAEDAAKDYESSLRELVKSKILSVSASSGFPRFDLVLLGMGSVDGHVASLFPRHPLTHEKKKWIAPITNSPKPPPHRITFTFPLINSAANVAMVLPENWHR